MKKRKHNICHKMVAIYFIQISMTQYNFSKHIYGIKILNEKYKCGKCTLAAYPKENQINPNIKNS